MHEKQKLSAKDKVMQNMTRDGLVERNLTEGGTSRVSRRIEDADFEHHPERLYFRTDPNGSEKENKRNRTQRKWNDGKDPGQPSASQEDEISGKKGSDRKRLREKPAGDQISEASGPVSGKDGKRRKKRLHEESEKKKKVRLSFEDEPDYSRSGGVGALAAASGRVSGKITDRMEHNDDDNTALQAAGASERAMEEAGGRMINSFRSRSHSQRAGAFQLEKENADRGSRLMFHRAPEESGASVTETVKKQQKKRYSRKYAAGWRAAKSGEAASAAKTAASASPVKPSLSTRLKNGIVQFARRHTGAAVAAVCIGLAGVLIASTVATLGPMMAVTGQAVVETTYLSDDEDILEVEQRYQELEAALQRQIDGIETTYPGYDEYRYQIDEISHNPYQLISYLTTLYGDFTYDQVRDEVERIFREQYRIELNSERVTVTEVKDVGLGESLGQVSTSGYCSCPVCCGIWSGGPTASGVYPSANHTIAVDASNPFVPMGTKVIMNGVEYTVEDTGAFDQYGVQFDVYYSNHAAASAHGHQVWEAYLADDNANTTVRVTTTRNIRRLNTVMRAADLDEILKARMTEDQTEQYEIYNSAYGNRQDLFNVETLPTADGTSYDISPESLSDERFANMIGEAEKYLGYPYVWGGANPATSFDCSGFVCWVINHCGNGWNLGRMTAEGLRTTCAYVSPEDAQPGDLIFFKGTYNTSGASHVGIYVGNGMMIHCGNPIKYASIETSYWQQHFYCFGRLP